MIEIHQCCIYGTDRGEGFKPSQNVTVKLTSTDVMLKQGTSDWVSMTYEQAEELVTLIESVGKGIECGKPKT